MSELSIFDQPLVVQAQQLQRAGLLSQALELYKKALKLFPKNPELLLLIGALYQDLGENDRAANFLGRAVKVDPQNYRATLQLGISLSRSNLFGEAQKAFGRAIALQPESFEAHLLLGNLFAHSNKRDQAREAYFKALEIQENSSALHYNLGVIEQIDMRMQQAIKHYRRAIELQPDHASAHSNLSVALCEVGLVDEARLMNNRALQIDPCLAQAHFNAHAYCLIDQSIGGAIDCLRRAHELEPADEKTRLFLAVLLDYAGFSHEAAGFFVLKKPSNQFTADVQAWRYIKQQDPQPLMLANAEAVFAYALRQSRHDGMVMEFGVYQGTSINQIAKLVQPEIVHGFDSFQGIPEDWNDEKAGSYSMHGDLPLVVDNVRLHPGWFEESLPRFLSEHSAPARFLNIDCDLFSSTRTVLTLVGPRIGPGTVLVFDEFIGNVSWQKDEFKAFEQAAEQFGWSYRVICFCLVTKQVVIMITRVADAET